MSIVPRTTNPNFELKATSFLFIGCSSKWIMTFQPIWVGPTWLSFSQWMKQMIYYHCLFRSDAEFNKCPHQEVNAQQDYHANPIKNETRTKIKQSKINEICEKNIFDLKVTKNNWYFPWNCVNCLSPLQKKKQTNWKHCIQQMTSENPRIARLKMGYLAKFQDENISREGMTSARTCIQHNNGKSPSFCKTLFSFIHKL